MIIGGQAILLYGNPRLTKDIDITLGIGMEDIDRLKQVIQKLRLKILIEQVDDFIKKTMVLPVIEEKSGIRVDFIFSFSEYEKQAILKANPVRFGKTTVDFASLEDMIIHKIVAGRARDIEDIMGLLAKNKKYNTRYIHKWLKEFDKTLQQGLLEKFKKLTHSID